MLTIEQMAAIELTVKERYEGLSATIRENPDALLEWTLAATMQKVSQVLDKKPSTKGKDLLMEIAEANPRATGHQIIAAAPRC